MLVYDEWAGIEYIKNDYVEDNVVTNDLQTLVVDPECTNEFDPLFTYPENTEMCQSSGLHRESSRASLCRLSSDAVSKFLTPSLCNPDGVTSISDAVSSH
ncbi:hypothetical protein Tco_1543647, partial [Tanacetum coccineum]